MPNSSIIIIFIAVRRAAKNRLDATQNVDVTSVSCVFYCEAELAFSESRPTPGGTMQKMGVRERGGGGGGERTLFSLNSSTY